VTTPGFGGRASLASGSTPTPSAVAYRVSVESGSLRLGPASTGGTVLDVPLSHVRVRPLGRAGSVVVDVDESPLLLDFCDHAEPRGAAGAAAKTRRVVEAARGRRRRDRFLRAVHGGRS